MQQKMTDERALKRKALEHEITQTLTAQVFCSFYSSFCIQVNLNEFVQFTKNFAVESKYLGSELVNVMELVIEFVR